MKFQFKNPKMENAFYIFLAAAASIVFFFLVLNIQTLFSWVGDFFSILLPLVYGFIMAYILNSPMNFFDNKVFKFVERKKPHRRLRRTLAVIATMLSALIVVSAFAYIILPQLYSSIMTLVGNATGYLNNAEQWFKQVATWLNLSEEVVGEVILWVENFGKNIVKEVETLLPTLLPKVLDYSKVMISGISDIIIGIVLSVYLLYNKETYFAKLKKFQYAVFPKKFVDRVIDVAHESHSIFTGFIVGKLLDSLMVAIICFIGCLILQVPFAGLIAAIIGVFNIIPVFGPIVGVSVSTFILLVIDPLKALWFLIFIIILMQIDGNIIEPRILGDSTGLSAFWVMIAILIGGGCFGFFGMFLSVPTFAVLYSIICKVLNKRLKKKEMPLDLESYASDKHQIL